MVADWTGDSLELVAVDHKLESVEETVGDQSVGTEFVREFIAVGLGNGCAWPVTVAALRKQVQAATSCPSLGLCRAVVFHPGQTSTRHGLRRLAKP